MIQITIPSRTAMVLLILSLLIIPGTAVANHLFADVADGHPHEAGIQFAKSSGVSIGCKDGTVFCPNDPVTRAEMATFLHRLSGQDPNTPPSVDADTVDGVHAASLLRPLTLYASVAADGSLVSGNAASAAKSADGHFQVTFGYDTSECVSVANTNIVNAFATAIPDGGVNVVGVFIRQEGAVSAKLNVAFDLVVVCPSNTPPVFVITPPVIGQ